MTVKRLLGMLGVAATLVLVACGGDAVGDSLTERACADYRATSADFTDGLLTVPELRERMVGIEDDASKGSDEEVAAAARDLLAALTTGSTADAAAAIPPMAQACVEVG